MTPRWHEVIVPASLHHIGDRPAIDLKMESQIPSKVRNPQNNETPTRLGSGGSDRRYANQNKKQKECSGGGVFDFMASCYAPDSLLASAAFINFPDSPPSVVLLTEELTSPSG
jgi:hypothetical protein